MTALESVVGLDVALMEGQRRQQAAAKLCEAEAKGLRPASERQRLDILFLSTPDFGHMIPLMRIAEGLLQAGHRVRVATCDYGAAMFGKRWSELGAEFVPLETCFESFEQVEEAERRQREIKFIPIARSVRPAVGRLVESDRPDVIVNDFAFAAGVQVAVEKDIPLVMNLPGNLKMMAEGLMFHDAATYWSFGGFHFARTRITPLTMAAATNVQGFKELCDTLKQGFRKGMVTLVQSVWGLDEPRLLPPNVVMTGPVLPAGVKQDCGLAADHPELEAFLRASSGRVVYVSTGSLVELRRWQVEAIFSGLKQVGCRVVWSLKEQQQQWLPDREDPDFHVSAWLPQAQILQHDSVAAVIAHCGWGGVLELVHAAKPVVAVPFFGDQPDNAKLLIKAGVGVPIGKLPADGYKNPSKNPYKEGDFTPTSVAAAVAEVLKNPALRRRVVPLQRAAKATGGQQLAVQTIEQVARYGTEMYASPQMSRAQGSNPLVGVALALVVLCVRMAWLRAASPLG